MLICLTLLINLASPMRKWCRPLKTYWKEKLKTSKLVVDNNASKKKKKKKDWPTAVCQSVQPGQEIGSAGDPLQSIFTVEVAPEWTTKARDRKCWRSTEINFHCGNSTRVNFRKFKVNGTFPHLGASWVYGYNPICMDHSALDGCLEGEGEITFVEQALLHQHSNLLSQAEKNHLK